MHLGLAIRNIRLSRGFSQEQLAVKADLAQNVISRIERDKHKPSEDTLKRLSKALNVEPDVFYYLTIIKGASSSKLSNIKSKIGPLIEEEIRKVFSLK